MIHRSYTRMKKLQQSSKKIPALGLLYILNLVIFILLFSLSIFDAYIFKFISLAIARIPFPEILRTILLTLWMIVPQTLLLLAVNKTYLRLSLQKFILTQVVFGVSIVLILYIVIG